MADAADSKSADGDIVRVQVPSSAPLLHSIFIHLPHIFPTPLANLYFMCQVMSQCAKRNGHVMKNEITWKSRKKMSKLLGTLRKRERKAPIITGFKLQPVNAENFL